jgi:hypothetical protein
MFFIKVKNYPTLVKVHGNIMGTIFNTLGTKRSKKDAHKSIMSIAPKVEFYSPKRRIL